MVQCGCHGNSGFDVVVATRWLSWRQQPPLGGEVGGRDDHVVMVLHQHWDLATAWRLKHLRGGREEGGKERVGKRGRGLIENIIIN